MSDTKTLVKSHLNPPDANQRNFNKKKHPTSPTFTEKNPNFF